MRQGDKYESGMLRGWRHFNALVGTRLVYCRIAVRVARRGQKRREVELAPPPNTIKKCLVKNLRLSTDVLVRVDLVGAVGVELFL